MAKTKLGKGHARPKVVKPTPSGRWVSTCNKRWATLVDVYEHEHEHGCAICLKRLVW